MPEIQIEQLCQTAYEAWKVLAADPGSPVEWESATVLGGGWEQQVARIRYQGHLHVVKKAVAYLPAARLLIPASMRVLNQYLDVAHIQRRDYLFMRNLCGELLPAAQYVYARDETGCPTAYMIQRWIEGTALSALSREEFQTMVDEADLRRQFLELIWASKKVTTTLGAPPDVKPSNIIMEDATQTVRFFDPGSPTLIALLLDYSRRRKALLGIIQSERYLFPKLGVMQTIEELLQPTAAERAALDETYALDPQQFERAVRRFEAERDLIWRKSFNGVAGIARRVTGWFASPQF